MKNTLKILFCYLFILMAIPSFGQSKKKMEKYLTNNWVSAAKTYETGDTIQKLSDRLNLEKKGKMHGNFDGFELSGTWKYLEDTRQLELTISMDGRSEATLFDIGQSSDQVLAITRRRGETFMTIILVEKGSGLIYKTVKVPEKSFDEIQIESDANRNADLGYTPTGKVIERVDYNFELEVEVNGNSGSSKGDGIVYLLESTDESQKVVIIRGQNAMPEEWTVLNKTSNGVDTYYHCNLKYDYKRGEKIEVNTKAKVRIASPNVLFYYEDDKTIKFTIIQD